MPVVPLVERQLLVEHVRGVVAVVAHDPEVEPEQFAGARRFVSADDPWLHLAPGEGDVAVTFAHQPGALDDDVLDRHVQPREGVQ